MIYWSIRGRLRRGSFSLEIELEVRSRWTVLLGPNGSGKSTLLSLLAGGLALDVGEVTINGLIVSSDRRIIVPPERRDLGYLPQGGGTFPWLSVKKNLELGGLSKVKEVAERWGLGPHFEKPAAELSGGLRQRVCLARALSKPRTLYLFDEPLAMVDVKSRSDILQQVRAVGPSVWVTHELREMHHFIDPHVVLLEEGKIAWQGGLDARTVPSYLSHA